jgi:Mg-chelatase subunit ChlD
MNKYINKKKAILLLVVISAYVIIITPLIIINLQKQKELRSKANITSPTPTPAQTIHQASATCGNVPTDIELIIDRSGSMNDYNKMNEAKDAATKFVDVMARDSRNRLGLISFSDSATTNNSLTDNFTSIKNNINNLQPNGLTCIECAVKKANQDIATNGRPGVKKAVILLTDGKANYIDGSNSQQPTAISEQKAIDAVNSGYNASKTNFFTIGFGSDVNTNFLKGIASSTGAKYYFPAPSELNDVYQEISQIIAKGILGGFVFNDTNGNGVFDSNENKQSGWTLQLTSGSISKSIVSDNTGAYNFTDLCDGTYTIKEVAQPGWRQTAPTNPNGYTFTITNGNSSTDKNFGNMIIPTSTPTPIPSNTPTPIPTPATTFLDISALHHGVGNSGDNTNPTSYSLSNKNPKHQTVEASLELYNLNNELIGQGHGPLTYDTTQGNFQGSLGIYPNTFPTGKYYLKVKTDFHLKKQASGILSITAGQKNTVPATTLVTGDSDNNNKLDILDYNRLLDCYSDLAAAAACEANKKISTDFNDDSLVNQVDYNLFIREIATQPGE